MRVNFRLGVAVVLFAGCCSPGFAGDRHARAVVELFTSQGCSSCPPADQVLAELARDPDIVALSLPVDYWDYLGWRDTLAKPGFTSRQKAYADQRGDRQVYTPQVVVNGVAHALGSDKQAIEAAAADSQTRGVMRVPITVAESGERIQVHIGAMGGQSGTLWLLPLSSRVAVAIGRGENRDRSVTYWNVVRAMTNIGEWSGEPKAFDLPIAASRVPAADGYAVLLQAGSPDRPGPILGAAMKP